MNFHVKIFGANQSSAIKQKLHTAKTPYHFTTEELLHVILDVEIFNIFVL